MAKEIPDEVQERIDKMAEAYRRKLMELWEWSNGKEKKPSPTAVEIEDEIREWIRRNTA